MNNLMHILNTLLFGFLLGQHFVINPQRIAIAYNQFKDAFDIDAVFIKIVLEFQNQVGTEI